MRSKPFSLGRLLKRTANCAWYAVLTAIWRLQQPHFECKSTLLVHLKVPPWINEPFNIHECDELKWFSYFIKSPTTTFNFALCQTYYLFLKFLYYDFIKYDFFSIQMMSFGTLIGGDCDFNLNTVNQDVVIYPLCRQFAQY